MNNIRFLKVKIKSLTAESRIIRTEELRSRGDLRYQLRAHRRNEVRREQRATLIAYGFLRGRPYSAIEPHPGTTPDWEKVDRMIKKYGTVGDVEEIKKWRETQQSIPG